MIRYNTESLRAETEALRTTDEELEFDDQVAEISRELERDDLTHKQREQLLREKDLMFRTRYGDNAVINGVTMGKVAGE